ncbi:hypothetical protein, partial [Myroides odoratimimus]
MKVRELNIDSEVIVFVIVNQDNEDVLEWEVEATQYAVLPDEEGNFFVKGLEISNTGIAEVYVGMILPERISEIVLKNNVLGQLTVLECIETSSSQYLPSVASECYGDYELYYVKSNPKIGIDVLKEGLQLSDYYGAIAEDLGYIYRDEECINEAIEAFKISEEIGVSSCYIYKELADLYDVLGNTPMKEEYNLKYIENGGLWECNTNCVSLHFLAFGLK